MRILLTNDDGIHAPGLKTLIRIARRLSSDIWVVAPDQEQSGAGHSLSLTQPLRSRKLNERRFAVSGTPTDCVMMAVKQILPSPPDLILSGVNRGANIAEDVTYSGTIAAAMEGTLLGIRSMALSQVGWATQRMKWATAQQHAPELIQRILDQGWPENVLMNLNFPDVMADKVEGVRVVPQGFRDQSDVTVDAREDGRGLPYYWLGLRRQQEMPEENSDIGAVWRGHISVSPLTLDLTHYQTLKTMKAALEG